MSGGAVAGRAWSRGGAGALSRWAAARRHGGAARWARAGSGLRACSSQASRPGQAAATEDAARNAESGSRERLSLDVSASGIMEKLHEREAYMDMVRNQLNATSDTLKNGVFSCGDGSWGFVLSDISGRVTKREGFATRDAAKAEYVALQDHLLTPPLSEALRESLKMRYDVDLQVTDVIDQTDSALDLAKLRLLSHIESAEHNLLSAEEARKMSKSDRLKHNKSIVEKARALWIKDDPLERARAESAAARLRQTSEMHHIIEIFDQMHRLQANSVGSTVYVLETLREIGKRTFALPYLMQAFDLNRFPILNTIETKEQFENAVFFRSAGILPQITMKRMDEMFPSKEAQLESQNISEYYTAVAKPADIELAFWLQAQHRMAATAPEVAPTGIEEVLNDAGLLPKPKPYDDLPDVPSRPSLDAQIWQPYDALDKELLSSMVTLKQSLKDHAPSEDFLFDAHPEEHVDILALRESMGKAFVDAKGPELMEKIAGVHAMHARDHRMLYKVGEKIKSISQKTTWNNYHSQYGIHGDEAVANREDMIAARSGLKRAELERIALADRPEGTKVLPWEWTNLPSTLDPVKEDARAVLLAVARPEAIERAQAFLEELRESVPFARRCEILAKVRSFGTNSFNSIPALRSELLLMFREFGPHAPKVAALMNDFFATDSFRFLATFALQQNQLEASQCVFSPSTVAMPPSSNIMEATLQRHTHLGTELRYNEKTYTYPGSPRLLRNALQDTTDTSTIAKGLPEARMRSMLSAPSSSKSKGKKSSKSKKNPIYGHGVHPPTDMPQSSRVRKTWRKYDWLGMNGEWYASQDDAVRTWFTPDIVGSWLGPEEQVRAIQATRSVIDAIASDVTQLVKLHQAVRPESNREALVTIKMLLESLHGFSAMRRSTVYSTISNRWVPQDAKFYANGRSVNWGKLLGIQELDRVLSSYTQFRDLAPLIPQITQNVNLITPEKIAAVDFIINGPVLSRDEDDNVTDTSLQVQAPLPVAASRDTAEVRAERSTRYSFENLHAIGKEPGKLLDYATVRREGPEDWVRRTIYLTDLPVALGSSEIETILANHFGEVEKIDLHTDRSLVSVRTTEFLREELGAAEKKKSLDETSKQIRNVHDIPSSLQSVKNVIASSTVRSNRLRENAEFYTGMAYDAIMWSNENWATVEVVWAAESDLAWPIRVRLKHYTMDPRARALEPVIRTRVLNTEKLSAKLYDLLEDTRRRSALSVELIKRLKDADKEMNRRWRAHAKNYKKKYETDAPWPSDPAVLNSPDGNPATPQVEEKSDPHFQAFKSAAKYTQALLLVTPKHIAEFSEGLEHFARHIAEVNRRRDLIECLQVEKEELSELKQAYEPSKPLDSDDGFVVLGPLSVNTSGVVSMAVNSDELDSLNELESRSASGKDLTLVQGDDDEAEVHDELDEISAVLLDDNPSGSGQNSAQRIATEFGQMLRTMGDGDASLRLQSARNVRNLIRRLNRFEGSEAAKKEATKKLLKALVPQTGHYAFVTFKDQAAWEKAMSPSVAAFGVNFLVSSNTSDPKLFGKIGSKPDAYPVFIKPAWTRKALLVGGFEAGTSVTEAALAIEARLQTLFPGIKLSDNSYNSSIVRGSCFLQFNSHAEAKAAYECLNGIIVTGSRLSVGWADQKPRRTQSKDQSNVWVSSIES